MVSQAKFKPEVSRYLEDSLCNHQLKEMFGLEDCSVRFSHLLRHLCHPPAMTSLRMNLLQATKDDICVQFKAVLTEQYAKRDRECPEIHFHPQISDAVFITNEGPNMQSPVTNEVIIDVCCGASVLRGSDIYAKGILSAPSGMERGDKVSVYADFDGQCRRGLTKPFEGSKIFLGNGVANVSRREVFCGDKKLHGVGVFMIEPLYLAPSLSDLLVLLLFPQNLPSIICVHVLDPREDETILDMCAAPGGKTTHIASLKKNKGRVIALDKSRNKIDRIRQNAVQWNLTCIEVYEFDATKAVSKDQNISRDGPPPYSPGSFDRVLLDAPCSGLGQRPAIANNMSLAEVKSYPALQRKLFEKAVDLLKENGTLVYSTCTITTEENEGIVAWALDSFPHLKLAPQNPHLGGIGHPCTGLTDHQRHLLQRFGPNLLTSKDQNNDKYLDTIGFFIAKFVKTKLMEFK